MTLTNYILQQLQDPENRKIVNEGQDEFEITLEETIISKQEAIFFTLINDTYNFTAQLQGYSPMLQFMIIRHCIDLLPCFEADVKVEINPNSLIVSQNPFLGQPVIYEFNNKCVFVIETTIRQALLSAPVLTLGELEEYAEDNNLIDSL